jgi:hypothetical protein
VFSDLIRGLGTVSIGTARGLFVPKRKLLSCIVKCPGFLLIRQKRGFVRFNRNFSGNVWDTGNGSGFCLQNLAMKQYFYERTEVNDAKY